MNRLLSALTDCCGMKQKHVMCNLEEPFELTPSITVQLTKVWDASDVPINNGWLKTGRDVCVVPTFTLKEGKIERGSIRDQELNDALSWLERRLVNEGEVDSLEDLLEGFSNMEVLKCSMKICQFVFDKFSQQFSFEPTQRDICRQTGFITGHFDTLYYDQGSSRLWVRLILSFIYSNELKGKTIKICGKECSLHTFGFEYRQFAGERLGRVLRQGLEHSNHY